MKKAFALSAILAATLVAFYFSSCNNPSSTETSKEDSIKKVVARGEYLAVHVAACIHCHSTRDFNKYTAPVIAGTEGGGGQVYDHAMFDELPGTFYSKNITPDPETGIGSWTDDEILRSITQGISKNGDTLFPLMPYASFNSMAKDDLLSIIAYLRTLKPIKNKVPARQMMIPASMAYPGPVLKKSVDENIRPAATDQVKYGAYLATIADCSGCHTPIVQGQPDMSRMFGGGNTFTMSTFKVTSSNITPDSATGIGSWSEAAFIKKFADFRVKSGYDYDPGKSNTIMPVVDYSGMTDEDLKAIYAFLRTTNPVVNKVEKYPQ